MNFEQGTLKWILVFVDMCHLNLLKAQNIYQPSFGNFGCRLSDSGSVGGLLRISLGSVGGPIGVHLF